MKKLLFLLAALVLVACSKTEVYEGQDPTEPYQAQTQVEYQQAFTRSLVVEEDGTWVAPIITVVNSINGCTIEDFKIVLSYEDREVSEISEGTVSIGEYKVATYYEGALPFANGTTLQWEPNIKADNIECFNTADVSYSVKMQNGYSIPVKLRTKTPSNILGSNKLEIIIKASGSSPEFESDRIILHSGLHPIGFEVTVEDWVEVDSSRNNI